MLTKTAFTFVNHRSRL